jgi:bifunctional polynucleotide phosphatase/kinase
MSGFQEEITSNGHILYWYDATKMKDSSSNKILGMDLDWTLIRPIKGKIHPLDENDWQFLYDAEHMRAISDKIATGYKFVIFTNQGGLLSKKGGSMGVEEFKSRWYVIIDRLEKEHNIIPFALVASLYDDFNRKPCGGMWQFLEEIMQSKYGGIKINHTGSLYVGDMAGRKGDHSASDLLFAMNLEVPFQVPEVFYSGDGCELAGNKTSTLIKNVLADEHVFNPKLEKISKRTIKINTATKDEIQAMLGDSHIQCLVIFIGSPASGKSSWYDMHLKDMRNLVHLGMDTFNGTLTKFHKEVEAELKKGKNVIVDNTNGTSKTREKLIKIARDSGRDSGREIQVIAVHFTTEKRICLYQNSIRTKEVNVCALHESASCGHNVPAVAIHAYWKHFEWVNIDKEDIDVVYTIEWEPILIKGNNEKDEKRQRLWICC